MKPRKRSGMRMTISDAKEMNGDKSIFTVVAGAEILLACFNLVGCQYVCGDESTLGVSASKY